MMSRILDLPSELLEKVCLHLPGLDNDRLQFVCSDLRNLVKHSSLIQYHIELWLAGDLVEGPKVASLSLHERTALLEERRHLRLLPKLVVKEVKPPFVLPPKYHCPRPCKEFRTFSFTDELTGKAGILHIPSNYPQENESYWMCDHFLDPDIFMCDPSRNLMIIGKTADRSDPIQMRFAFLTLDYGVQHPESESETMCLSSGEHPVCHHGVLICPHLFGDLLLLHFRKSEQDSIIGYNWRKGSVTFHLAADVELDLAPLEIPYFMVSRHESGCPQIDLHKVVPNNEGLGEETKWLATFNFPVLMKRPGHPRFGLQEFETKAGVRNCNFYTDPKKCFLLIFKVQKYWVYVHVESLFRALWTRPSTQTGTPWQIFEWSDWGPQSTRFSKRRPIAISGYRVLTEPIRSTYIYDFNALGVLRDLHSNDGVTSENVYVDEWAIHDLFEKTVYCRLPFRQTLLEWHYYRGDPDTSSLTKDNFAPSMSGPQVFYDGNRFTNAPEFFVGFANSTSTHWELSSDGSTGSRRSTDT